MFLLEVYFYMMAGFLGEWCAVDELILGGGLLLIVFVLFVESPKAISISAMPEILPIDNSD